MKLAAAAGPGSATASGGALAVAAILCTVFGLACFWPARDSMVGWGSDPWFNLWTFEIVWHRIAQHGILWFLRRAAWSAPLFGGSGLGLAYSETQAFPALLLWPLRQWSGNGAWTLQAGAVALPLLALLCTTGWLRALGIARLAPWGGLLFAASGWAQSQRGHYQNLCLFVVPLALWAFEAWRVRRGVLRALLAGALLGWMPGWNLYYFFFCAGVLAWLLGRSLWRRQLSFLEAAAFGVGATLLLAPFAVRYAELDRALGGYRAFLSYGTHFGDLFARLHAPRLLPPHLEATGEAGGLGLVWIALCVLSLRVRRARPWLLASALAYWVALGSTLGAWQLLSQLPVVNGMRAIGRAQLLVILFSIPPLLLCLESLRGRLGAVLLLGAILELVPQGAPERVPVDPAWFRPTPFSAAMERGGPVLIVPLVDHALMLALASTEAIYFGGWSGRVPPGEELLSRYLPRVGDLADAISATGAHSVLARTPETAQGAAALPGAVLIGRFAEGTLFGVPPGPPPISIVRDAAPEESQSPWPTLKLRAIRAGTLSIRELDSCRLREELRLGPFAFDHELRLQGNELLTLSAQPGEVLLHHQSRRAVFRLQTLRPSSRTRIVCD